MEQREILARCRDGDELAWEALIRLFQGRVYSVCCHYLGNREEARDVAQDVFVRLYQRLDACTNDDTFVPWLIQMTRNACIDRLRRIKSRPLAVPVPVDEMVDLRAPGPSPEEESRASLRRDLVHRALHMLSLVNREMIVLKEIQGLSLEEIARLLRVPIGTVKSRSNRARIELARHIRSLTGTAEAGGEPR